MKPLDWRVKRVSRTYYWCAWFLCNGIASLLSIAVLGEKPGWMIVVFVLHVSYLSLLTVKRFHDAGYGTGYALFCILLSIIGIGTVLILLVAIKPSDVDNQWGSNLEYLEYQKKKEFYGR